MDIIKAQLDRIRQQLAGLTASQRMLVGTLVAVMVLTLLYWGRYAGNPEMVAVLDQSLNEDEIGRIDMALEAKGIPHSVSGGRVMVPADRKMEIVADLMYSQMLPHDSRSMFEEMNKDSNPFAPQEERQQRYVEFVRLELTKIVRRFPGVADAQILINAKNDQRIENPIKPSATIAITMRNGQVASKQLVIAAADGVAGAISGMTRAEIRVSVDGIPQSIPNPGNSGYGSDDFQESRQKRKTECEQKILDQFAYISGLRVTVAVEVENTSKDEHSQMYDGSKTLVKPLQEETHSTETNTTSAAAADPGTLSNTGASIVGSSGGGGGTTSTDEENKTTNQVLPSVVETTTRTPPGKPTVQSATVRVPRSYIAAVYKQRNPAAKDPDDNALKPIVDAEMASIKDGVKKCLNLKSDDQLSVDTYSDLSPMLVMATTTTPPVASMTTVTGHVKEISIGLLAVVSLFMMFSMVRKATPAPVVAAVEPEETPQILSTNEGLAGEVGMGGATLDGVELDEDAVRNQQLIDQVSTMVKENPDGAASLVKRWLNRS